MFCPYIRKAFTRITKIKYNQSDLEEGSTITEFYIHQECPKEECGAWHEGRCKFNGS